MAEIQTGADQNPEILIGTKANLDQANKYNSGTVGKYVTLDQKSTRLNSSHLARSRMPSSA